VVLLNYRTKYLPKGFTIGETKEYIINIRKKLQSHPTRMHGFELSEKGFNN
jgi:hypothetical protein